jgi:hypothetical protein
MEETGIEIVTDMKSEEGAVDHHLGREIERKKEINESTPMNLISRSHSNKISKIQLIMSLTMEILITLLLTLRQDIVATLSNRNKNTSLKYKTVQ